ncbi:diguanylate cyclase [Sporocytophaga myxococcoides]|uniref:histidine kinase n=1 Tax=Sporocytophaga myxococcoides TaxID=153721 RepID=A0A098L8L4_9BACT|nr:PAS domain-containing protein [Sporocytophaga myxococcoides]GAL83141.1 diguanylate cyclase [Sporocytophaga myxococcoides]
MEKKPSQSLLNVYSQENLLAVLDRISDAFVALDRNWCYTYMNKKAGEIFGRDPISMIGKHIWTEFPEGIDQPFYKAYYKAMETQQYIYLEEYYPPFNKWFENNIYPSAEGLTIYFRDITSRKLEEQQIRIDKARLLKAQEIGQLGYWELEKNKDVIWGSEKACELFGFAPVAAEIPISKIEPLIKEIDKVRSAGQKLIQEHMKYDIEVQICPENQDIPRIISAKAEIAEGLFGNNKIMGIIRDITEQKRIEMLENLEKSVLQHYVQPDSSVEELITFLLNGLRDIHPDMLCSVLKVENGRLYNWSSPHLPEAFNKEVEGTKIAIGYGSCGSAAFLRKKVEVSDIFHHPYWDHYMEIIKNFDLRSSWSYPIINSKDVLLGTFAIYHKSIRELSKEEENSIDRVRRILVYVMERKLAETEAKLYKEKLELVFNSTNEIMFLIDIEKDDVFRFSTINKRFLDATELSKEDIEGKLVEEVIPNPSYSLVLSKYKEAIEKRTTVSWEETTNYPAGEKKGIVTISPVFNEDNECVNLIGNVHDITDRKKDEEKIKRANEKLKINNELIIEKNKKLKEIAWYQSHKVRAPVARIMGLINLIELNKKNGDSNDDLLGYVLQSAVELDEVTRDLVEKISDSDAL